MRVPGKPFYIVGGTIPRHAPSYIPRQADEILFQRLYQGQFCYVLTSRQMGKSSLMVRTAARLRQEGVAVANLDLTALGQNLSVEQWYDGLLNLLARSLELEDELEDFWLDSERYSPLQRWMLALRDVVLAKVSGPVVLFIDEIDAVRSLPFSADEFFAAIRECYNRRTEDPAYERLSFCLLGVATPSDLIRDTRTTPFNIGHRIDLDDFTRNEATLLGKGFHCKGEEEASLDAAVEGQLLERVLHWTGGHPYLTQRLCQAVADELPGNSASPLALVDRVCDRLFLSAHARERDDNLIFVRERLLRSEEDIASVLEMYGQVHRERSMDNDEANPRVSVLRLSGIVRVEQGHLVVRNRIYQQVFDGAWVRDNLPDAEIRRQRAAYQRGVLRTSVIAGVVLLVIVALALKALHESKVAQKATTRAQEAAGKLRIALQEAETAKTHADSEARHALSAEARAEERRKEAVQDKQEAVRQTGIATAQTTEAQKAKENERQKLWLSYLSEGRARHWSSRPGQRYASLEALAKAARIRPTPELRNVAIAAMALPVDIRRGKQIPGVQGVGMTQGATFDENFTLCARPEKNGDISVRRVADNRELVRLPAGIIEPVLRFSPDGKYLAASQDPQMLLWEWRTRRLILKVQGINFAFRGDSHCLAVAGTDQVIHLYDLSSGKQRNAIPIGFRSFCLSFHPDGHRIALASDGGSRVQIRNADTGKLERELSVRKGAYAVAWSGDGRLLAANGEGRPRLSGIYVWDVNTNQPPLLIRCPGNTVSSIAFSHRGHLLVSSGWDNRLRLWDAVTGLLLMNAGSCYPTQFSRDDRHLGVGTDATSIWYWDVVQSQEVQRLGLETTDMGANFSPDGRLIAAGYDDGTRLFETATGKEVAFLPGGHTRSVLFAPEGNSVLTAGVAGIVRWSLFPKLGRKELLDPPYGEDWYTYLAASQDGRWLVAPIPDREIHVLDTRKGIRKVLPASPTIPDRTTLSPDGRWVATGSWSKPDVRVYDTFAGRLVKTISAPIGAISNFTPDGRYLLVSLPNEYQFWEVTSWRKGRSIPTDFTLLGLPVFSPDGKLLVVNASQSRLRLLEMPTLRELAQLELPDQQEIIPRAFSPDGSKLLFIARYPCVWDIRLVRQRLKAIGLDWEAPPLPPERPESQRPVHFAPLTEAERKENEAEEKITLVRLKIRDIAYAIKKNPKDAYLHNDLAWRLVKAPEPLRDAKRALFHARKACELSPDSNRINTLGVAYYRAGDYLNAVKTLQKSIEANKGVADAFNLFFLAMAYQHLGQKQEARSCFDNAIKWWQSQPNLASNLKEELQQFRAEAETVLRSGITP